MRGRESRIVTPNANEVDIYADPQAATCGSCCYFDVENGRKLIIEQQFAERLVREQEWQLKHLAVPVEMVGVCGQSNGELAVTLVSRSCDQYRPQSGRAGAWRP